MTHTAQHGFILTRHWRDAANGTEIEFWLATDDGPKKIRLTAQTSVAFAEARQRSAIEALIDVKSGIELRELALKTFQQEPVVGIYASRYKQLTALERTLREHGIKMLEADIRPPERFLMERFITAAVQFEGGHAEGAAVIHNCKLKPAPDYRPKLKMVSLDIETSAFEDLYSIALEGCGQRQVYMLGAPQESTQQIDFDLEYCATPRQLIEKLNAWFVRHDPDVLVGWNVVQFDLRVLQKNADKHKIPLALGREGKTIEWREHPGKQGYMFAPVVGRIVLDGIDALKAASWTFPSFSLENVSQAMLGEGKDIGDVYDKMAEIERRFHDDKPALAHYNLKDCELVTRIFDKANLLAFMIERATVTGLQADHLGGSIAAFGHHYLPRMHREGYVAPSVGDVSGGASPGGFVMDSKPGLYDSVVVLDYKSLYPSIIRTFLVDPVGLVEGENAADQSTVVEGVNGTVFSRTRHCLPEITTQIWKQRDAAKRARNEPLSQALKLLMNSFCGVLGATECRFFNPRLVSSVTLRGHQMMKQTRELVEAEGYDVIYGDTDSIFIWLKKEYANSEALAIGEGLAGKINSWWRTMLMEKHGLECHLEIEFDTHYQKFFMPTIRGTEMGSKKRYAGLTINAKGEEEVIYRGLEVARSDWTPLAQQFQQGLFKRIFKDEPYQEFVRDYARKTMSGDYDELLVYRKRLRQRLDEYKVNVPPQVRAARLADEYNQAQHRPLRYQNGGWISYVMTTSGPEPTEVMRSNIDYEHYLTKQLQPIADSILLPMHDSFTNLTTAQASLF
ncbi:DNA polymerase II [Duganella violaceipulchra]|uniref:DNA polymerase n=1 Tax=Duganella violaceipulchra TaxID=2849652 RepID=A0AA41HE70_9BURK|nr:DNA polymerase II [Duganella violaceicalia]MBV6322178.1 DNA polymerase II [Duganella violaceicalia]MCP2011325.1 DNA polymerase-2 [Duganella violaceicalia]